MYNTEGLHKHWLFYGEYFPGVITLNSKSFSFYVDATSYDPERLLFQVHRGFLNTHNSIDGSKNVISPDAFKQNPKDWLSTGIHAIFRQYIWETKKQSILMRSCSTMMASEKKFKPERILFSKCGINFIRIHHRSLKSLTPYPEAIDIE